jgi:ABC-type multidrug transport system fused ATPase/permease subunit
MIPISVLLGLLELVGVILLGTVGTLAFKVVTGDAKPTRLEVIFKSILPSNLSGVSLTLVVAILAIFVLGTKTIMQALINFRYINFLARLESDLASKLFGKIMRSQVTELNSNKYSEYQYALTNGANRAITGIVQSVISIVSDTLTTIFMAILAFNASPIAFFTAFLIFGLTYYIINGPIHKKSLKYGNQYTLIYVSLSERLLENFRGIKEVKVYRKEIEMIRKFDFEKKALSQINQKINWISSISRYFFEISLLIAGVGIIAVLVATADMRRTVTALVIFMAIGYRLIPNIQRIQAAFVSLRIAEGSTSIFFEMLNKHTENAKADEEETNYLSNRAFEFIELRNVDFNYFDSRTEQTLSDISMSIKKNTTLGIVGDSGSGKTTVADIIAGVNRPTRGEIFFNNESKLIGRQVARPRTGYVSQSASLFGEDIYENIAFGSTSGEIDKVKIDKILESLNLSFLVKNQFENQKRSIRSDGTNLSGGEKQRIAIARVQYADSDLVIFDEPTSALDEENKVKVTDYIKSISGFKTIVIVTHSMDLLNLCDSVLEIAHGRVTFFGDSKKYGGSPSE